MCVTSEVLLLQVTAVCLLALWFKQGAAFMP